MTWNTMTDWEAFLLVGVLGLCVVGMICDRREAQLRHRVDEHEREVAAMRKGGRS